VGEGIVGKAGFAEKLRTLNTNKGNSLMNLDA